MKLPATMKAGLYFNNCDIRVEERPVPAIGPGEALAEVRACGICGSDIMQWYRQPATVNGGINTGHEIAGRLVAVGEAVSGWRAGDRVVITHHFPCLECAACREGNETACEAMHQKHIEPGGFAQYLRVLESGISNGLYRLPDHLSYEEGSFVEPLGCALRSVRKTAPLEDRSVLILGSGLAGLLHIKLARALGAAHITAIDTSAERLRAAERAGADHAASPAAYSAEGSPAAERVFICTGSAAAAGMALDSVSRGGQVLFFASDGPSKTLPIPLTRFWFSQPTIHFSYGAAPRDLREAMEWIAGGRIEVRDLVTHRFNIEQVPEAFHLACHPTSDSLKIIVQPNGE